MKFSIIFFLFPLILSSTETTKKINSFNFNKFFETIINQTEFKDVYYNLKKAIDYLSENILDDENKKIIVQKLGELFIYFYNFFQNNKEYIEKLNILKKKLNEKGISENVFYNGANSVINYIFSLKIDEKSKELMIRNYFNNMFIHFTVDTYKIFFKDPKKYFYYEKLLKNNYNYLSKISNNIKYLNYLKYTGNLISSGVKAYDKISNCKNKNSSAYLLSSAQAISNFGTNMAFSSVGSFLGSFIPIPIVGTFVGGLVGNYVGDYVNSLYDFDC